VSLGEDAKVTILATGMEDSLKEEVKTDVYRNEDEYFENLIPLLYKPAKKTPPTMAQVIAKQQEIVFDVEPAPEPEPAVVPEPEPEPEPEKEKTPSAIDKLKNWLNSFMKEDPNE
jgi:cell division protein FtsZ